MEVNLIHIYWRNTMNVDKNAMQALINGFRQNAESVTNNPTGSTFDGVTDVGGNAGKGDDANVLGQGFLKMRVRTGKYLRDESGNFVLDADGNKVIDPETDRYTYRPISCALNLYADNPMHVAFYNASIGEDGEMYEVDLIGYAVPAEKLRKDEVIVEVSRNPRGTAEQQCNDPEAHKQKSIDPNTAKLQAQNDALQKQIDEMKALLAQQQEQQEQKQEQKQEQQEQEQEHDDEDFIFIE